MKIFPPIILVSLFLTACNNEQIYTKDDFLKDNRLYAEYAEKCENNAGQYGNSPNCINFSAARKSKIANDLDSLL